MCHDLLSDLGITGLRSMLGNSFKNEIFNYLTISGKFFESLAFFNYSSSLRTFSLSIEAGMKGKNYG